MNPTTRMQSPSDEAPNWLVSVELLPSPPKGAALLCHSRAEAPRGSVSHSDHTDGPDPGPPLVIEGPAQD